MILKKLDDEQLTPAAERILYPSCVPGNRSMDTEGRGFVDISFGQYARIASKRISAAALPPQQCEPGHADSDSSRKDVTDRFMRDARDGKEEKLGPAEALARKVREQAEELSNVYMMLEAKLEEIATLEAHSKERRVLPTQLNKAVSFSNSNVIPASNAKVNARTRALAHTEAGSERKKWLENNKRLNKILAEVEALHKAYSTHDRVSECDSGLKQSQYIHVLEQALHIKAEEFNCSGHEQLLFVLSEHRHKIYDQERELEKLKDTIAELKLEAERAATRHLDALQEHNRTTRRLNIKVEELTLRVEDAHAVSQAEKLGKKRKQEAFAKAKHASNARIFKLRSQIEELKLLLASYKADKEKSESELRSCEAKLTQQQEIDRSRIKCLEEATLRMETYHKERIIVLQKEYALSQEKCREIYERSLMAESDFFQKAISARCSCHAIVKRAFQEASNVFQNANDPSDKCCGAHTNDKLIQSLEILLAHAQASKDELSLALVHWIIVISEDIVKQSEHTNWICDSFQKESEYLHQANTCLLDTIDVYLANLASSSDELRRVNLMLTETNADLTQCREQIQASDAKVVYSQTREKVLSDEVEQLNNNVASEQSEIAQCRMELEALRLSLYTQEKKAHELDGKLAESIKLREQSIQLEYRYTSFARHIIALYQHYWDNIPEHESETRKRYSLSSICENPVDDVTKWVQHLPGLIEAYVSIHTIQQHENTMTQRQHAHCISAEKVSIKVGNSVLHSYDRTIRKGDHYEEKSQLASIHRAFQSFGGSA